MTREESIQILRHIVQVADTSDCGIKEIDGIDKEAIDMVIKELEQEPKTGHWVKYGISRCGEQHYKCTSCGYYINFGQWGELYTKEFKYCPNCGARMSENNEDRTNRCRRT